ncbi:O-fucosyltransferase 36-like [Magnolia sinica]|uniref:O-fucosyltransferase 36-like n=1 Tax=Magnolia sinica TaxID=86752 RepID=UPI002657EA1E|nr:O-fucosyltransferase 36-like [Magnolia sinica]
MERDSSDEEDDRENLIDSNHASKIRRSSFEIGEFQSRVSRSFAFNKRYLIVIFLAVFLIIAFFSFDIGRLFRSTSSVRIAPKVDRMREAELHALYLLRNQQIELLNLWNRTSTRSKPESLIPNVNSTSSNSSSNATLGPASKPLPPSISFDDFRSALFDQIKLNKEIQETLLSAHRVGNVSDLADDDAGPAFVGFGADTCRKVDRTVLRQTIEWKPKSNRYLFAICISGQMSNHLICLQKHMFFAALLSRMLVLPSPKFDYQYDRVIDIDHLNQCFGRKVAISFEEFSESKKGHLHIDRFICYMAKPPCFLDEEQVKRLKALGISMGKLESAWPEDAKLAEPKKRVVDEILPKFSCDDEVLAIGDIFYADVEEEWVMQPGGPLAHKCKTVIQPSRLIMLTAQRFVQTFLGGNFVALHFRRHGFLKFCNAKKESCFFPVPQAAECILRVAERANAPVIYLSTDAAESETNLLQSLTLLNGKMIPLVKRPTHTSVEKWDALLYRNHLGGDDQVDAMLDKTICAMSNVFIGASGSTFTEDILRLRKDLGYASVCDEYLCRGEQPNFIADSE